MKVLLFNLLKIPWFRHIQRTHNTDTAIARQQLYRKAYTIPMSLNDFCTFWKFSLFPLHILKRFD